MLFSPSGRYLLLANREFGFFKLFDMLDCRLQWPEDAHCDYEDKYSEYLGDFMFMPDEKCVIFFDGKISSLGAWDVVADESFRLWPIKVLLACILAFTNKHSRIFTPSLLHTMLPQVCSLRQEKPKRSLISVYLCAAMCRVHYLHSHNSLALVG